MRQDDDHNESVEENPSFSQGSVPEREDEMIEHEIGDLMDQLTQVKETQAGNNQAKK
jgi:hypothetical protein